MANVTVQKFKSLELDELDSASDPVQLDIGASASKGFKVRSVNLEFDASGDVAILGGNDMSIGSANGISIHCTAVGKQLFLSSGGKMTLTSLGTGIEADSNGLIKLHETSGAGEGVAIDSVNGNVGAAGKTISIGSTAGDVAIGSVGGNLLLNAGPTKAVRITGGNFGGAPGILVNGSAAAGQAVLFFDSAGFGTTLAFGTLTGCKIGAGATDKMSFWGVPPVVQQPNIAPASGGVVIDAEARTAISLIINTMITEGLIANS